MQCRPSLLDGFPASTRLDLTPFYDSAIEDVLVPHQATFAVPGGCFALAVASAVLVVAAG
jgi:hypothetical protein